MRLLIATRNRHKVDEIRSILGDAFEYSSLADFADAPEVVEDQPTFEGNARKKAVEIAKWQSRTGILPVQPATRDRRDACPTFVLADDSGLEVDALDGAPGVLSARYAGSHGDAAANNRTLLEMLREVLPEKRAARFRCVIAIAPTLRRIDAPDAPNVLIASGSCEGRIIDAPRGEHGFGYDPLFVPNGYTQTFAELGADVKDRISHRARALAEARALLHRSLP